MSLKIVYMGTPEFAVPPLKALGAAFDVAAAVSQPDKAKNRGKKVLPTPVHEAADELGIPVLQPEKVKGNPEFINQIKEIAPDVIVVAAYGKILPVELLEIPKYGCYNIHASLLPRFRGAAPVQRCIIAGDEISGVTIMAMEEGLDTGDMFAKAETSTAGKTGDGLEAELSQLGAELIVKVLPLIVSGELKGEKQDDSLSCYAKMLNKSEGLIDFSRSAEEIERLIRGMYSWPGTYTYFNGEMLKIWEAQVLEDLDKQDSEGTSGAGGISAGSVPGTVLEASGEGIKILCGRGILNVKRLQMPGKKALDAADFLRGRSLEPGTLLGNLPE